MRTLLDLSYQARSPPRFRETIDDRQQCSQRVTPQPIGVEALPKESYKRPPRSRSGEPASAKECAPPLGEAALARPPAHMRELVEVIPHATGALHAQHSRK